MFFPDELLDFIRAHRDELTLSVYIEAAPADPAARRNWRVRLRQGLNDVRVTLAHAPADEQDAFERCAAEVLARLPNGDAPATSLGWACFATAGGGAFCLHLRDTTDTSVSWGPGAQVVPYLRVATEPRALVVRIDKTHVRIDRWVDGAFEPLETLEAEISHEVGTHMGDAPRVGFHDGTRGNTRTDTEQRHRIDATERLFARARQRLLQLAVPQEPILIGGTVDAGTKLRDQLPDQLEGRAMLVPALTMPLGDGAAAAVVVQALHEFDAALRVRRVTELREMAHARGRAAVGLMPARAAADLGALAELIFSERAWKQHPDEIEDLVRRALFEGADVALAPSRDGVAFDRESDGVIAGLRFPLPTMR